MKYKKNNTEKLHALQTVRVKPKKSTTRRTDLMKLVIILSTIMSFLTTSGSPVVGEVNITTVIRHDSTAG